VPGTARCRSRLPPAIRSDRIGACPGRIGGRSRLLQRTWSGPMEAIGSGRICRIDAGARAGLRRGSEEGRPMDRGGRYRMIVRRLIEEYASYKPSHGQIESEAIVDPERDHYEVMHVGWDHRSRVHGCVVHVAIIDGKVWVQYDGTNRPIADEMVAAGIPRG